MERLAREANFTRGTLRPIFTNVVAIAVGQIRAGLVARPIAVLAEPVSAKAEDIYENDEVSDGFQ